MVTAIVVVVVVLGLVPIVRPSGMSSRMPRLGMVRVYRLHPGLVWLAMSCAISVTIVLARPTVFAGLVMVDVVGSIALSMWSRQDHLVRNERATLPELADAISTSLRGGETLAVALDASSHLAGRRLQRSLGAMARSLHHGVPVAEVMAEVRLVSRGRHDHETQLLLAAVEVGCAHPAQRGRAMADTASSLRLRRLRREDLTAQAAQARASATVVTWSPWVVVILASLVDPSHLEGLVSDSFGRWCVVGALTLSLAGAVSMRVMIHRSGLS